MRVQRERVAGPHRLEPLEIFEARRAKRLGAVERRVDCEPHGDAARLPTACNQSLPAAVARASRIDVEPLRIVSFRELDDVGFGQNRSRTVDDRLSGMKVGESHRGVPPNYPAVRRSTKREAASSTA